MSETRHRNLLRYSRLVTLAPDGMSVARSAEPMTAPAGALPVFLRSCRSVLIMWSSTWISG